MYSTAELDSADTSRQTDSEAEHDKCDDRYYVNVRLNSRFGLVWFAFLRPVPARMAVGVIRSKSFKHAGEYWQQPVGRTLVE